MDRPGETPQPPIELALDPVRIAGLRRAIGESGRAQLAAALDPGAAAALREELLARTCWVRSMRKGASERSLDPETIARLTPAQLAAIEALARNDDGESFRFLRDTIHIPREAQERAARGWLIDRLVDGLNRPAMLELAGELAGKPVSHFDGGATRYLAGHFLTTHNDRSEDGRRALAVVINLSHWQIDWGGLLLFHGTDGNIEAGLTPAFNTANIFVVPAVHSVTWVTPLALEPRLTVSGWFYSE